MRGAFVSVVVLACYAAFAAALIGWMRSRLRRRAEAAAAALRRAGANVREVRAAGWRAPAEVDFELEGRSAQFLVRSYGRDYIAQSVQIPADPLPPILIRAERALDRFGKHLGLNREAQVGDAAFDAAAYIETAAPDAVVARALASAAVRAPVLELLARGYSLEMSATGLRATQIRGFYASFEVPELGAVIQTLRAVRDALPRFEAAALSAPRETRSRNVLVAAFAVLGAGLLVFPAIAATHPPYRATQALAGMGYGLIAWALALVLVGRAVRGRPHGFSTLLLAAIALFFGLPPLTGAALFALNSAADRGPVTTRTVPVLALWSRDHEARVPALAPGQERDTIGLPRELYRTLRVGDAIEIDTRPGALGWTWVTAVRRAPR